MVMGRIVPQSHMHISRAVPFQGRSVSPPPLILLPLPICLLHSYCIPFYYYYFH